MKKSPSRKKIRMRARSNRRAAGRKKAAHHEWLQKPRNKKRTG